MSVQKVIFAGVDVERLSAIAMRVVSVETITEAQEFARKIREATEIAISAVLRIAGLEDGNARALMSPVRNTQIEHVRAIYETALLADAKHEDEEL